MPTVRSINLGGGFKVGRMPGEASTDLTDVGAHVRAELEAFRQRDGRSLHLELEPGTYLVANAGTVVATCIDVVDTGREGYRFAKEHRRDGARDAATGWHITPFRRLPYTMPAPAEAGTCSRPQTERHHRCERYVRPWPGGIPRTPPHR